MNIAAIKDLVGRAGLDELKAAEDALLNERSPTIEIPGADEGEKLTHVLAAIYVTEQVAGGVDVMTAIRTYAQRVRASIS
jgi:hypothetical protein